MYIKIYKSKQIQFKWIPTICQMVFGPKNEVHYIGGTEVLPPPLEAEEEAACISCLGENGQDQAKSTLIEHNLRLVVYIAKKFDNTGIGVEDLISIGTIGLIKGVSTFKPDKNVRLATYASRCIENAILSQRPAAPSRRASKLYLAKNGVGLATYPPA